jgi:ATP-dependent DNA helicase RecG
MDQNKAESQSVKLKESWRDENLKFLCAFAITEGEWLAIGRDNGGNTHDIKNYKNL